jgi:hypothetical protein
MPGERITMTAAAAALGVNRKILQRWRKLPGAPFASDGSTVLEELRAWASAAGLLGRRRGRRNEVDRLVDDLVPAPGPVTTPRGNHPAAPAPAADVLAELTAEDRELVEGLISGDQAQLINLASRVQPGLLKRLAVLGRTRRELAEAERREIANRLARGELLSADEVRRFWAGQIQIVKNHFAALPGKLAPRLVDQKYDAIFQVLEEELDALLETFSREVPS